VNDNLVLKVFDHLNVRIVAETIEYRRKLLLFFIDKINLSES
jgi:hypothetical protein